MGISISQSEVILVMRVERGDAKERELQRAYYARTANTYDASHLLVDPEHRFALGILSGLIGGFAIKTVLDVGAGTGRVMRYLSDAQQELDVVGIEPVKELREIAIKNGVEDTAILDGDGYSLGFADNSFDCVCAFGVLHHVRRPDIVVEEMLRVARVAIFISDGNNFGQGSFGIRLVKQMLRAMHLWAVANALKTRGKGYMITEGDGLAYSYSVFQNYKQIRRRCKQVHIINTSRAGINPLRTASHVALFGVL